MSALSTLRKRSGLLAAVVGFALLAFVLTGLFESGFTLFGEKNGVGEINGTTISYDQFMLEYNKFAERQMKRSQTTSLDDQGQEQVSNAAWDKFIRDLVMVKEFDAAGVSVSDAELADMFIGQTVDPIIVPAFTDQQTGQVNKDFVDARGQLSGAKIKEYIDKLSANPENADYYEQWKEFEEGVRENKVQTKYFNLIKKGLQITTTYAKQDYNNASSSIRFRYVLKRYNTIPDSTITVTDAEMQKFYNENKHKYKQEGSRKLDYIVFDVFPSEQDSKDALNDINRIADEFKKTTDDSAFVVRESENKVYNANYLKKSQLPPSLQGDSNILNGGSKGYVTAPYLDGNKYKVDKLLDTKMSPDSASVRHILVAYQGAAQADPSIVRSKDDAKKLADSLLKVFKKSTKDFKDLVKKYSADKGSIDSGGVYKWFKEGMMVPEFQNAAFFGKKGDVTIAETMFGFHVIEVLDRGPESMRYKIASVEKTLEPSSKTRQEVYNQALDFIASYGANADDFNKGVKEKGLTIRTQDKLKTTDKFITGLESPKELIRWTFTNEKGSVSKEPFAFKNKYVVAAVAGVSEKGIATMEERKTDVELGAKMEKKAQMFIDEFNKTGAKNLNELAQKMKLLVDSVPSLRFNDFSITALGRELKVIGTVFALEPGKLSPPVKGEQGVFVIMVEKFTPAPENKDFGPYKTNLKQSLQYRVDGEVFNVLKEKANIKDDRYKFF
jgi:peptidyl-prolyl cis-trans isomerase D